MAGITLTSLNGPSLNGPPPKSNRHAPPSPPSEASTEASSKETPPKARGITGAPDPGQCAWRPPRPEDAWVNHGKR